MFCLFCGLLEPLKCEYIVSYINTRFFLKLICNPVDDSTIDIFSPHMRISTSRFYLNHIVSHFKNRDIKCSSSKVIDDNFLIFLFIESICERSCSRLVNNSLYLKTCNFSCIFCCLSLCIVKVCRNSDNRLGHLVSKSCLCI